MRKNYDFTKANKNPYVKQLKKPITIRMSHDVIDYFKTQAEDMGVPYQTLINLYLRDCMAEKRKPSIQWKKSG